MSLRRDWLVCALLAMLLPLLFFGAAPILQPAGYHQLADQRPMLGIGHFWNVVSNVPFLVVGLMGLDLLRRKPTEAAAAWSALFGGSVLVALGSACYHSHPVDATLIWDRVPLLILSLGAIWWWRASGDLSLWVWVQAAPMLAVVLVLALLPGRYTHRRYLAYALACYAAAKLFELGDLQLMQWTAGVMSGHALKHFAAAAGVWCFYVMLRERSAIGKTS